MKSKHSLAIFPLFLLMGLVWIVQNGKASNEVQDQQEIRAALSNFYLILDDVSLTYNVARFSEVLIDTSDCRPDDPTRLFIEQTMGKDAAASAGYLTALQAKYIARGKAAKRLEAAKEKASAENRDLSQAEKQQIVEANGGVFPPTTAQPSPANAANPPAAKQKVLDFVSSNINNDRATVRYDDGLALQEAILVRKDGTKWFVACIKPIQVHF